MAHSVSGIDGLLKQKRRRRDEASPFHAIFLFTRERTIDFMDFFWRHFEDLHQWSGDVCTLFTIAPPLDYWSYNRSGDYSRHFQIPHYIEVGYYDYSIELAARHFSLPREHLPTAVIFRGIQSYDVLSIRLGNFDQEVLASFLYNLFSLLQLDSVQSWRQLRQLVDILPSARRRERSWLSDFVDSFLSRQRERQRRGNRFTLRQEDFEPNGITYRIEFPQTVETILTNVQNELDTSRFVWEDEPLERMVILIRETTDTIGTQRRSIISQLATLDVEGMSPEEIGEARERLHTEFDEFIEQTRRRLVVQLQRAVGVDLADVELPDPFRSMQDLLEPESLVELRTAELLWQHFQQAGVPPDIDYSVCGIGLWKALEIEVNRTFVDALRVHNKLCSPGQPSVKQRTSISGHVAELGRFGRKSGTRWVQINDTRWGRLQGITLGPVAALMANSRDNSLKHLLKSVPLPLSGSDRTPHSLLKNISKQVRRVADDYRNRHAHMQPMDYSTYEDFRSFIFDARRPHSPLLMTLHCKEEFQKAELI